MSSDVNRGTAARSKWVAVPLSLVFAGMLVAVGVWLWQTYDPLFVHRPEVKEAKSLMDTAQAGTLSDGDFDRAMALLDCDIAYSQLVAITLLQREAERTPQRRDRVIGALEQCSQKAEPQVRQAAATTLTRMQSKQGQAP